MWYVLEADQDAHLIAGFRRGVSAADFMRSLEGVKDSKPIIDYVYRFQVLPGDTFFVPSGRIHAIDAGVVLVEIQQNSDTTYRVYDWGRVGTRRQTAPTPYPRIARLYRFQGLRTEEATGQPWSAGASTASGDWSSANTSTSTASIWPTPGPIAPTARRSTSSPASPALLGLVTPDGKEDRLNIGEFILLPAALGFYTLTPWPKTPAP